MYILLILFFASLLGIIIMIGRKLALTPNGQILKKEYAHPFVPDFQKIKHTAFENIKKYGHLSLVEILRFHIRATNFFKYQYNKAKDKIKNIRIKRQLKNGSGNGEVAEASKFLKMISDYKRKIREIKHKIHEEERNS